MTAGEEGEGCGQVEKLSLAGFPLSTSNYGHESVNVLTLALPV